MEEDLNLVGNRYSWLLTIFYIAYSLFQFVVLAWKVFPPRICTAVTVFAWFVWISESIITPT
jgi:retrograde regulation protein 2